MSNLDNYKSDTLMLIVGSNPLPNYVAAMLLAKDNARLVLIHTDKTKNYAERIFECLQHEKPNLQKALLVPINAANGSQIFNSLDKYLSSYIGNDFRGTLGLNFTGGTKAMAVYIYDWVKNNVRDNITTPIFSYLDSRTYSMFINEENEFIPPIRVLNSVDVTIPQLIQLQRLKITQLIKEPQWADEAGQIIKLITDNPKEWESCKKGIKSENQKNKYDKYINEYECQSNLDDGKIVSSISDIYDVTKKDNQWINGGFLEDYVLNCVRQIADECNLTDYGKNIVVKSDEPGESKNFEFDVAFTRGYQLFGISCTAANEIKRCKPKLFEAYIRARQMGGDEARVALVCFYDRTNEIRRLQKQLEDEWDVEGKIKVFGKDDIPKLKNKLRDWINYVGRD